MPIARAWRPPPALPPTRIGTPTSRPTQESAKDRIGTGPWYNAKGDKIADDVASLHSDGNNLTKQTALDETGAVINGRGDTPNRHDILTGSMPDGTAAPETCGNWTMGGAEGAAMVGPHRPHRA